MNTNAEKFWIPRKVDNRTILKIARTPPEFIKPTFRLILKPDHDGVNIPFLEEQITCTREQYDTYMRSYQ